MSDTLYQATAPVIVRALSQLSALLDKAVAHGLAEDELLNARVAPDMLPFTKQIQIASDISKGAMARLSGATAPAMADTETTVAQLKDRIARTIAYVKSIDPATFEGAAGRKIEIKFPSVEMTFSGAEYVSQFVLPNLFFHVTVAYALIRARGVEIGKNDYLPLDLANVKFTG